MNTAYGQTKKIPKEFEDAILFTVTRDNKFVGVKIFPDNNNHHHHPSNNENNRLEYYIEQSVKRAIELKSSVENGWDIVSNGEIIWNPCTKFANAESLIQSRSKGIEQAQLIDAENRFMNLGKIIIQSLQIGKGELVKCEICLGEMYVLSMALLTPLMLKKNPDIVRGVSKLCRYADTNLPLLGKSFKESCSKLRKHANKTLGGFKRVMGFRNGTNEEFLRWFYESVELFHELTANITDDERRKLTSDPASSLTNCIVA